MVKIKWGFIIKLLIVASIVSGPSQAADNPTRPPGTETYTGQLAVYAADNFVTNTSQRYYSIRLRQQDGGYRTVTLTFDNLPPDRDLQSGDTVSIQGRMSGNTIAVDSIQREPIARTANTDPGAATYAQAPPPMETRRAVVLIISMEDAANTNTAEMLAAELYTNPQSTDGLFRTSSYQQLSFSPDTNNDGEPDIFGPFTIADNARDDCDEITWAEAADAAAKAAGINLRQYQHRIYSLPSDANCIWAGFARLKCPDSDPVDPDDPLDTLDPCRVWIISRPNDVRGEYIAHELGHNLGWRHATTDPDNDGNIDVEYGDASGIMGMPFWAQANAPHRDQLRWFDAYPGTLVSPTCSDTFHLHALELDPGVDTVGIQAIKIPKPDTNEFYYLSYRREIGTYPSKFEYADKINVHRYQDTGSFTYHITNLDQYEEFVDTSNGITVTAAATGEALAAVAIDLPNDTPAVDFSYTAHHRQVQFYSSGNDPDGAIEAYLWDFGDQTTSNESDPNHRYAGGGNFEVRLTVTDNCGATASQSHNVRVTPNNPPNADFSFERDELEVQFTNAGTDGDGTITSCQWDFGDGASSSETNPTHTYAGADTYSVALTVTDDDGDRATVSKEVTVAANVPPTASFSFTTNISFVQFSNQSSDSDGAIVSHLWDFGDGTTSIETAPAHTYAVNGTFTVTLTVTDDSGATHTDSQNVTVAAPIIPAAIPDFTFDINELSVQFTDSCTGGPIDSYAWDFGDGAASTESSPSHTYAAAGTYIVKLTVTNIAGSNTAAKEISVPSSLIPDFTFNVTGFTVQFTDNTSGTVVSYAWDFGDGDTSTEGSPSHAYAAAGTYTVGLTVTNAAGSNTIAKEVSVSTDDPTTPAAQSSGGGGGGGCFIHILQRVGPHTLK
jgi:PKD repeat protein